MKKEQGALNLYLVVSEELQEVVWEDWFNQVGHEESYRIAELVVARSRGQAKYLAWKIDWRNTFNEFNPDVRDMPKFRTALRARDVAGVPRIASEEYPTDDLAWCWPEEVPE